jgi:predicted protein tyrosine phosphatase
VIFVCNLDEMPLHARALRPRHLISLIEDEWQPETPPEVPARRHLRIPVHDVTEPGPGIVCPEEHHVATLIAFLRERGAQERVLVHCAAGISRSMAAAFVALALDAAGREHEVATHLRRRAPHAHPNRRIVALADRLLGYEGRLVAAREAMGPGDLLAMGPLVDLSPPLHSAGRLP